MAHADSIIDRIIRWHPLNRSAAALTWPPNKETRPRWPRAVRTS
jgi:hypothetical protein